VSAPQQARVKTGIEGLDDVLCGGLPAGRLYLLQGDPGVGKTTVALSFLREGARAKERCLYITLSETEEELRSVVDSHQWSLEGIDVFEMTLADDANSSDEYTLFHPAEVELSEAMDTLLAEVARVKPQRVVFDSLSEIRLLAQSSLRYRRQILALKQHFAGSGCTVLLLDDRSSEVGDTHLQSLAHGVIELDQLAPLYGAERRRLRIIKLRGVKYRGGYHDYKIATGALIVYPRLIASEHRAEPLAENASSGILAFDEMLGGGLPRGGSALIMGPPGTGKSVIAVQFAMAAAGRGEKAAFFAFDEAVATTITRADGLGLPLRRHVADGLVQMQQVDPAEMSPGEFVHEVRASVERGARVVVIDSLNGYLNAMPAEHFLVVQLHELLTFLAQSGVTTLLVTAQHGLLGSSIVAPVDVSYLADTVILLRYFESDGKLRNAVSIMKKRTGAHDRAIRLFEVCQDGFRVGEALSHLRGVFTGVPVPTVSTNGRGLEPARSGESDAGRGS
jgi:circadian clock protein KaiC